MTRRLPNPTGAPAFRGAPLTLSFEGRPVRAYQGETVAAALFCSGAPVLSRSLKYHRPRGFFCLEGHCGACLMRIGGVPNLRACMEPCRDGLLVEAQNAYPSPDLDVLEAVDWMFPRGMDHHTLMTGSRVLNAVANKVVRQLSGLGRLPDRAAPVPPVRTLDAEVLVIGAGPAGLAAATAAARAGARTALVDEHDHPGGSLLCDPRFGVAEAARRAAEAAAAGVTLLSGATVIAYYAEDDGGVLAVATADGLLRARPRRTVWATGGYAANRLFANNDRPGVLAARAVGRMLVRHGVLAGRSICLIGDDAYADALADALTDAGGDVARVDGRRLRVIGAHGRARVEAILTEDERGRRDEIACEVAAVSATPAPASEGPRQHGCAVELRPAAGGFAVLADADGRTSVPDVLACGDVCGFVGADAAAAAGERAGRAAARDATEARP